MTVHRTAERNSSLQTWNLNLGKYQLSMIEIAVYFREAFDISPHLLLYVSTTAPLYTMIRERKISPDMVYHARG